MLLNDRFVGTFGIVAAGDDELIVKVAVQAARNGFGVVPMQYSSDTPACALGVRDSKKPHDCYHVMHEDTKVRAAFQRLTKDENRCGLAIDLEASNIAIATDVSWWTGPEISPTMVMPDGEELYVFDLADASPDRVREANLITNGELLVPPSNINGSPVHVVGQLNHLSDNVRKEEDMTVPEELWGNRPQDEMEQNARLDGLETRVEALEKSNAQLQEALVIALTTLRELRDS